MPRQLDILALEPFYGGVRRAMLDTLVHYSRHRWTLLKLPPRRIERRLTTAAHWFAEQLSRHWAGSVDLLFTSEAMNLSDLLRITPGLQHKPSIVYFHSNQLPPPNSKMNAGLAELANLGTALSAHEIWFNSQYHLSEFLLRASAMVQRHPELSMRNPVPEIKRKARMIAPPLELDLIQETLSAQNIPRNPRMILVDTRDANMRLLNAALLLLIQNGHPFELTTIGPVEGLDDRLHRTTLIEHDEYAHVFAMCQAGLVLSAKPDATCDFIVIRAICAGCWPIVPSTGVYPEIIPASMHASSLYEPSPKSLAMRLLEFWNSPPPINPSRAAEPIFKQFDAMTVCKAMDNRMEELADKFPSHR